MYINLTKFPLIILIICIGTISCSTRSSLLHPVYRSPINTPIEKETKPIQISAVVLEHPEGHKLGRIEMGVLCIPMTDLKSIRGKAKVSENDFTDVVRTVLENADYNIVDNTSVNSKSSAYDDELLLRATVKDLKANVCFPKSGFRSWKISKGESYVKIYWQLYSKKSDKMLFERITEGSEKISEAIAYGSTKVILASVAVATQNLIADKEFNMMVTNAMN